MDRFHKVEDGAVVTLCRGIYRQAALFRRGRNAYASHGGGFVRLLRGGGTSVPHVSWKEIDGADATIGDELFSVTVEMPVAAE